MSIERQIALEEEYRNRTLDKRRNQTIAALDNNRASDVVGLRAILIAAHDNIVENIEKAAFGGRGIGKKYNALLRGIDPEVIAQVGLRVMLNSACSPELISAQTVWANIGKLLETERLLVAMQEANAGYTQRILDTMDERNRKSKRHIRAVFAHSAQKLGLDWEGWSTVEHVQVGKIISDIIVVETGLFEFLRNGLYGDLRGMYYLNPTEELKKYIEQSIATPTGNTYFPPSLVPPNDWQGLYNGGYFTEYYQVASPMCSLRAMSAKERRWVSDRLGNADSASLRAAMNRAQSTPYRVNKNVLQVLRDALAVGTGIMGLPRTTPEPKPDFPFSEDVDTRDLNEAEAEIFSVWKQRTANWYSSELQRKGRNFGYISKLHELNRFQDEPALYFPTFIDWRGRLYFRSSLNPQSSDAVKGCLEFAEGKRLGVSGLKWLKVQVANCAGYDKHSTELKVKWVDENMEMLMDFIDNPLSVEAPEPDTAFTLYQAGLALKEALALPNPEDYICHVPVAMDATCSGLQHFSAMLRDEKGGFFTNLTCTNADKKEDIYMEVAKIAHDTVLGYCNDDVNLEEFWNLNPVTRNMAKRPVMTYVYGSTLISTMDYVCDDLIARGIEPIVEGGKVLYSLGKLSVPMGKALRHGVEATVPKAAEAMSVLQKAVRSTDEPLRWITPVGMPVVNWAQLVTSKRVRITSLGVSMLLHLKLNTRQYDRRAAANSIAPNFIHSLDSTHLMMTINNADCDVLPIHDSFGTHPSSVDELHRALRSTFVELYTDEDVFKALLLNNNIDLDTPAKGTLDINDVLNSEYMFS